jgi:hypothetical protein
MTTPPGLTAAMAACAWRAADGVDHVVEGRLAGGPRARVEAVAAGVALDRCAAQRVDLGHAQRGHALVAQQQRRQHADRAAAQHQHAALGQRPHQRSSATG